jgi:methanogenic corrinoid protein MtbC1
VVDLTDIDVDCHGAEPASPYRNAFRQALLDVDRGRALRIMEEAREALCKPGSGAALAAIDLLDGVLTPALEQIGLDWEKGRLALTQVYIAGRICEDVAARFLPLGSAAPRHSPRMGVTVLEDYHMLGQRMVLSTLRAAGFGPIDYGRTDVPTLVESARRDRLEVLLVSALMLPAALRVRALVDALRAAGLGTRVIVGGAPFRLDRSLWREVGADSVGDSASDAVRLVLRLSEGGRGA